MWCFFFASRRRAACLSACQHPAVCWWRVFCPPSHRGRKCRYTNPAAASPTFLGLLWRGGEDRLQQTEALQPHGGPVNDSRSEREAQQRRRRVTVATSLPKKTAGAGRERGVRGWACFGSRHEPRISVARTPVGCAKLRSTDKDYPAPHGSERPSCLPCPGQPSLTCLLPAADCSLASVLAVFRPTASEPGGSREGSPWGAHVEAGRGGVGPRTTVRQVRRSDPLDAVASKSCRPMVKAAPMGDASHAELRRGGRRGCGVCVCVLLNGVVDQHLVHMQKAD